MDDREPVRVFISSNQSEFEAERTVLTGVIRRLPLLAPVIAEAWPPDRDDIRKKFLLEVRRCPIYVGLFGRVYSEPTMLEYEAAVENPRRAIMIYVRRVDPTTVDPQLVAILQKMYADHTIAAFDTVDDLKRGFARHLWSAVKRIIEAYVDLWQPAPTVLGPEADSVLGRLWHTRQAHLRGLGLPGGLSADEGAQWAGRLTEMLRDAGAPD